jgi:hypothetical protein
MKPVQRVTKLLSDAARMERLLADEADRWWEMTPQDAAAATIYQQGKPYMRVGFALQKQLTALAKAEEALDTCEQLWPALRRCAVRWRRQAQPVRFLHRLQQRVTFHPPTVWNVLSSPNEFLYRIAGAFDEIQKSGEGKAGQPDSLAEEASNGPAIEAVGYFFSRYRDSHALAAQAKAHNVSLPTVTLEELGQQLHQLDKEQLVELMGIIRDFRIANVMLSWIRYQDGASAARSYPGLFGSFVERGKQMVVSELHSLVPQLLDDLQLSPDERENLDHVLQRVQESIAEVTYPHFLEAILEASGQDGQDSMIGNTRPINLIPSRHKGACCPLLLAAARSNNKRSATGLPMTLRKVKTQLITCSGITRVVVVLTDTWDADEFREHAPEFRAWHQKGIRFLFLLVGSPTSPPAPIPIDFSHPF